MKTIIDTIDYYNNLVNSMVEHLKEDHEDLTENELEDMAYNSISDVYGDYLNDEADYIQYELINALVWALK